MYVCVDISESTSKEREKKRNVIENYEIEVELHEWLNYDGLYAVNLMEIYEAEWPQFYIALFTIFPSKFYFQFSVLHNFNNKWCMLIESTSNFILHIVSNNMSSNLFYFFFFCLNTE